jgi:hypothetical protein
MTTIAKIIPPNVTLLAFSPAEMATAQADLILWGRQKVATEQARVDELEAELARARSNAWGWKSWDVEVKRQKKLVVYYGKLLRAFQAGYLVIPDFPIRAFAIRTNAPSPDEQGSKWHGDTRYQKARPLPIGEGRYVSPEPVVYESERPGEKPGEMTKWYYAGDFREITFPGRMVKPEIVAQTERAMALELFDEVGLVGPAPEKRRDPIVVGRILDPRGPRYESPRRGVSYFISWWLDLSTL